SPVIKRGELSKKVYLPEGRWAVLGQSGNYIEGKRFITIDAPIDSIPVFAREGSIIPLIDEDILTNIDIPNIYQSNSEKMKKRIVLVYLGKDRKFSEYNGTIYSLRNISAPIPGAEPEFKIQDNEIYECGDTRLNCYSRTENGKYSVYTNSKKKLSIIFNKAKVAEFEIISKENFDAEVRLFY
ncbi:MAG: glycoside hydrolase family 31 protein, partial [Deltaproteobacteria bacterium]|nr:glycoside hydrolase family 31 protein [Deltaproteobacteria bacterium]